MTDSIEVVDVGPRDGLQNQPQVLDTDTKLQFIGRLVDAGVRRLEVASFANPKRVPQMAGAEELIERLPERDDVTYIGLVMNMRGFERAVDTDIDEINCVVLASDTFNERNQGVSIEETMQVISEITRQADAIALDCSVTIGAAYGCPFEGEVPASQVVDLAARINDMGCKEIALADTIGCAGPSDIADLIPRIQQINDDIRLRCHFHDTRNTAVANTYAAIQAGVRVFDASCGGIGGCPFAPAATGNVATEDLLYMIDRLGFETGIDIKQVMDTARWLEGPLGISVPSMVTRAGLFPGAQNGSAE